MRAKVVTVMRWYAQDEVNQEDSEHNEVDGMKKEADSTGKVTCPEMNIYSSLTDWLIDWLIDWLTEWLVT